jgi:uncharacterized protein DUF4238
MCRSEPNRDFFKGLVEAHDTREKFLNEITILDDASRNLFDVVFLNELSKEDQLKVIIGVAANHISRVFKSFNFVVLEAPRTDGRAWPTSDNPVVLDKQNSFGYIIPIESEIYLPLSRKYCLFMFHEASEEKFHPLRRLKENKVHVIDVVSHAYITMKIANNIHQYLVLPYELSG